jgi:hypothetical protein
MLGSARPIVRWLIGHRGRDEDSGPARGPYTVELHALARARRAGVIVPRHPLCDVLVVAGGYLWPFER